MLLLENWNELEQRAAAVHARLDLLPEVAHELLLVLQVALLLLAAMHGSGVINTDEQSMGFAVMSCNRGRSKKGSFL